MNTKELLGILALDAAIFGSMNEPTIGGSTRQKFEARTIPLTPKQKKSRAKEKRAKLARKINWN